MLQNNKRRSPLIAGFLAAAMGLHSPAGHDAIYQAALRGHFAADWWAASVQAGRPISFKSFRANAEIYAYDPNPEIHLHNMRLLKERISFCLPFINEGEQETPPQPSQNYTACHATVTRPDKKHKGARI